MTSYSENSALTLLSGALDAQNDPITLRRINGTVISSWPHTIALPQGSAQITQAGVVTYDDGGSIAGHPAPNVTQSNGSFTFTLWDGLDESPSYTADLTLRGASLPVASGYGWDPAIDLGTTGDYYVDTSVSASGTGTTPATAFKTIGEAYGAASSGDTIVVRSGTYSENLTLSKSNLTLRGYGTEKPEITGFDPLTGWAQITAGNKTATDNSLLGSVLANSGNVYKLNISGSAMAVNDGASLNLYENGTFVPLVQNRIGNADPGFFVYDEDFLRADSFTLNGSNQITAITDTGTGKDLSAYTSAQATNAIVYLYRNPNGVTKVNVTAFSGATLTVSGNVTVQGNTSSPNPDNLRYNLANILPELVPGTYGYVDVGNGTWDIYFYPVNPANLTSNIQYSARSGVVTIAASGCMLEGLQLTGSASNNALGGFALGDASSTKRTGLTVRNCFLGKVLNSSGQGYGAVYFKGVDNVLFENNSIERCYGAYGLFGNGSSLTNQSNNGIYRNNHVKTVGQAGFRFYTQTNIQVAFNFFETCGYGGHTNVLNFYEQSDTVLVYGNKARDALGYMTWQEASNLFIGFNDFPCNPDNLDDRSIQDQANSTPPPVVGSTIYVWNNQATPDPNNLNSSGCYDLGKPDLIAGGAAANARDTRFVMVNNIIHGGGVSEPYAGLGGGEQHWPASYETRDGNIYTDLAFWQKSAYGWAAASGEIAQTNLSLVYADAANGDFTPVAGSPILTHTGIGLGSVISAAQARFPGFDFAQDMDGNPVNTSAPKCGPRADPATWS